MDITVVTGPPAAGKTTHVHTHRQPGDLVIDFDAIAATLAPGLGDHPAYPPPLTQIVQAAWTAAATKVRQVQLPGTCWLIHATPPPHVMAMYQRHCHVVEINPGADVVMPRLAGQPHRIAWAEQWYANHH